jgi:tripeptide aminopeptidase
MNYVTVNTQSRENAGRFPSTPGQLELLTQLRGELEILGLKDVSMDEHGYVMATVPATTDKRHVPTIGFVAHVDTSPESSGEDVKPILHRDYQGQDLALPDDPSAVLRMADDPALEKEIGRSLITASGKTLLGADDKAGVAEIVGAAEYLIAHPEILHGDIRIAFTPDEEIGRGADFFDVGRFAAHCAYTLDGGAAGRLEFESFSADSLSLIFRGFNTHPGYAKGTMVNSIKVAADFIHRLPKDELSPETTEGHEGYVHPNVVEASVDRTVVRLLIRDFDTEGLAKKERWLKELAEKTVEDWPGAAVDAEVQESYRNMREVLDQNPQVVELAREALRRAGLEPQSPPIRGGTDGSRLSFMGLPTPNIFAGQHGIHSRLEWASVWEMHKAVEVIIELAQLWEEQAEG